MESTKKSFDFGIPAWKQWIVMRVLGLHRIENIYRVLQSNRQNLDQSYLFCKKALCEMAVHPQFSEKRIKELRQIQGPMVFVANHPYGAIDALSLMVLMGEVRPDFKLVANSVFNFFSEIKPLLLPVEIMEQSKLPYKNIPSLRSIFRNLENGGAVGMFPAGEVAYASGWFNSNAQELPWHPHLGRMILKSGATVIPVFFEGQNSWIFQKIGFVFPRLRMILLAREVLKKKGILSVRIGAPIPAAQYSAHGDAKSVTEFLQDKVISLGA